MATASFELDTRDMVRRINRLAGKKGRVVLARALNKSAKSAKTAMVKVVRADVGKLKAEDARKEIKFDRAIAARARLEAKITVSKKRIPLIKFGGTPLKRAGYKSRLKGSGTIKGGFVRAGKGGRQAVFKRLGKGRLPVVELKGPSLAKVFSKHWKTVGEKRYREQLAKNLRSELAFELSKKG